MFSKITMLLKATIIRISGYINISEQNKKIIPLQIMYPIALECGSYIVQQNTSKGDQNRLKEKTCIRRETNQLELSQIFNKAIIKIKYQLKTINQLMKKYQINRTQLQQIHMINELRLAKNLKFFLKFEGVKLNNSYAINQMKQINWINQRNSQVFINKQSQNKSKKVDRYKRQLDFRRHFSKSKNRFYYLSSSKIKYCSKLDFKQNMLTNNFNHNAIF